jgi:hypothetical protein
MPKVAVEEALTPVVQVLKQNGYNVVNLSENEMKQADCVVVTGVDSNVMGMMDVQTKASVVNAEGKTAEQVLQEVQERVNVK